MIQRGNPLELSVEFEARTYNLGDTIDVFVELQPSANVSVRSGRLDLVCEERYIQRGESFVPDFLGGYHDGNTVVQSGQTSHVAQERKETFVHSSVRFMEETRLTGGATESRRVRLVVSNTTPPHFEEAQALERDASSSWGFSWTLVATVDVARGRDAHVEREVKIRLPK